MQTVIIRGKIEHGVTTIKVCLYTLYGWKVWHNFSAPSNSPELKEFLRGLDYDLKFMRKAA